MLAIASNIINEIKAVNQSIFSKDEIIELINRVSGVEILDPIESNGIILTPEKHNITIGDKNFILPRKEFCLLYYLISNKNKVMSRSHILRDIWGDDVVVLHRTIDVHIRKLRLKTKMPNLHTVKGIGYVWKDEINLVD